MKNNLWVVLFLWLAILSCSSLPSQTTAADMIKQELLARGQTDGGAPVNVTSIRITDISKAGNKTKINFTWSGIKNSPAIAEPLPPEQVENEVHTWYFVNKDGKWVLDQGD